MSTRPGGIPLIFVTRGRMVCLVATVLSRRSLVVTPLDRHKAHVAAALVVTSHHMTGSSKQPNNDHLSPASPPPPPAQRMRSCQIPPYLRLSHCVCVVVIAHRRPHECTGFHATLDRRTATGSRPWLGGYSDLWSPLGSVLFFPGHW